MMNVMRWTVGVGLLALLGGCVRYDPATGPVPAHSGVRISYEKPHDVIVRLGGTDTLRVRDIMWIEGDARAVRGDSVDVEIDRMRDTKGYFPVTPGSRVTVSTNDAKSVEVGKGSNLLLEIAAITAIGVLLLVLLNHKSTNLSGS